MIPESQLKEIAKVLKVDETAFITAANSETETILELPEIVSFTKDESTKRDENIKKQGYNDGRVAGIEIKVKEWKESFGVDAEGKDPDKFIEAYKEKILKDVTVEPNEKAKELEAVIEKQKGMITGLTSQINDFEKKQKETALTSKVLSAVENDYLLGKDKMFTLMKTEGYSFEEQEGEIVAMLNGTAIRNEQTQGYECISNVFDSFATKENLVKEDNAGKKGRGGKTTKTDLTTPTKYSEFEKQWVNEGKSTNSADFMAKAQELAKDNPDFFKE